MGLPWGVTIALVIALSISAAVGDGIFSFAAPELVSRMGSALNAAVLQTALSALLGSLWGAASVIWDMECWSLLKQSVLFYAIGLGGTLVVEYLCAWMDFDWASLLSFLAIFSAIFAFIWVVLYNRFRVRIRQMNDHLHQTKR